MKSDKNSQANVPSLSNEHKGGYVLLCWPEGWWYRSHPGIIRIKDVHMDGGAGRTKTWTPLQYQEGTWLSWDFDFNPVGFLSGFQLGEARGSEFCVV